VIKRHQGENGASGLRDVEAGKFNQPACRGLFGNLEGGEIAIDKY